VGLRPPDAELVNLNGQWPLWLPPHRAARQEWHTGWERERLDAMRALIEPHHIVWDIGSEEADMSALFASWAPHGGVVMVEPNPAVWANARYIWEANDLPLPLAMWVGFAGDTTEMLGAKPVSEWPECAYDPVIGNHGFCVLNERPDIPRITLDDLAEQTWILPDIISIDVEGAELFVLRGTEKILREKRPIVFCSVHPAFMWDTFRQYDVDLHSYMAELGYKAKHLATDHEIHMQWTPR
jgi:FkbM family methyltransferase